MGVLPIKQPPVNYASQGAVAAKAILLNPTNAMWFTAGSGAPTNAVDGAGWTGPGSIYIDTAAGVVYTNSGTMASPVWDAVGGLTSNPTFATVTLTGLFFESAADALTAHAGGGQASALALTKELNRVTTVATVGDSVKLPTAAPGLTIIAINSGANAMQVFGAGTDTIDDVATATGVSQMAGSCTIYSCTVAGKWYSNGIGTGYAGQFPTVSNADSIVAHAGGGQASAVALTNVINRVITVGTAADSVKLPAGLPGMQITVINAAAANALAVFALSGESMNGTLNGSLSVAAAKVATFYCTTAGLWHSLLSA